MEIMVTGMGMVNKRDMATVTDMERRKVMDMDMEMIKAMVMVMIMESMLTVIRLMVARRKFYWKLFQRMENSIIPIMVRVIT